MKHFFLTAGLVLAASTASAVPNTDAPWRGFLWPVKTDQTYTLSLGEFATLDACRRTAIIKVLGAGWGDGATWECGLHCVPGDFPKGSWICEDRTQ